MRKTTVVFVALLVLIVGLGYAQKSDLQIPPKSSLELDYADYEMYELQLKNKMSKGLEIKVVDKQSGEFVRGFGLGPVGKVEVMVEGSSKIIFTNTSNKMANLSISFREMDAKMVEKGQQGLISFTLVNSSSESIPLIIPNVMNPNLSPNSNSGVDLGIGQELIFRNKGKRYVLFTVDETIKNGDKIDVYKLLQERKKELGLK
ncbi:hypothetical protein [Croceivirga thetidis]|uniref:Gliding motility-associated protein GldM C-terminal domain-containing protein n=1 Tax=Croceivirga thetidis TaxID=2721623 RepID=A0ABX1GMB9_9FLAO|nr:hypothetical protein [Croceivirga thetidis]NKI31051.1 hypothetical protein [Croceivirga thetidis]